MRFSRLKQNLASTKTFMFGFWGGVASFGWLTGFLELSLWLLIVNVLVIGFVAGLSSRSVALLSIFLVLFLVGGHVKKGIYVRDSVFRQNVSIVTFGTENVLRGKISKEPVRSGSGVEYFVELDEVEGKSLGNIIVDAPKWPIYEYGDIVEVSGNFKQPENFGDSNFDYVKFLERKGVYITAFRPQIKKIGVSKDIKDKLLRATFRFKTNIINLINRNLPEPHASLMSGILMGARNSMPEEFSNQLRITGTTHIIAVSGYNMTIIIEVVNKYGKTLFKKGGGFVSGLLVFWFGLMTGMSPPVFRAVVSAILKLVANYVGVRSEVFANTILTGLVMLFIKPLLIYDISFLLTFAAVFGLIFWVPLLQSIFPWIPEDLEEGSLITLAATFTTVPISMYYFGAFSLISLVTNFLAIPLVGGIMGLGFLAVGISVVPLLSLEKLVFGLSWVPLNLFKQVVEITSKLEFLFFEIRPNLLGLVVALYLLQVVSLYVFYPQEENHRLLNRI